MICLVLGLWLGGMAAVDWIAGQNRLAANISAENDPAAEAAAQTLGKPAAEWLLRRQASAQNRRLSETWGEMQAVLGSAFLLFVLFGSQEGKLTLFLVLLMLVTVMVQLFVFVPQLNLPDGAAARGSTAGWAVWGNRAGEILKACFGLALALRLISRRQGSGYSGKNIDLVDKPNHGHIDR